MKRQSVIMAVCFSLACTCCTNDFIDVEQSVVSEGYEVDILALRSPQEAVDIALEAMSFFEDDATSRSTVRSVDFMTPVKIVCSDVNCSRSGGADTLMYVVNYADNNGFAVVAANRNVEPIIAVTEQGHYDPEIGTGVEPFEMYMDGLKKTIDNGGFQSNVILPKDSFPQPQYEHKVDTMTLHSGTPLRLKWGQRYIFGKYYDNGSCGCANIAIAMALSFFDYPESIEIDFAPEYKQTLQLDWAKLRNHIGEASFACSYCEFMEGIEIHKTLGLLLRQIGKLTSSSCDGSRTVTYTPGTLSGVHSLGFKTKNPATEGNGMFLPFDAIDLVHGDGDSGGHLWVRDAVNERDVHTLIREKRSNELVWKIIKDEHVLTRWNHFNWGWFGNCNGYFIDGVFTCSEGDIYDNPECFNNSHVTYKNLVYWRMTR